MVSINDLAKSSQENSSKELVAALTSLLEDSLKDAPGLNADKFVAADYARQIYQVMDENRSTFSVEERMAAADRTAKLYRSTKQYNKAGIYQSIIDEQQEASHEARLYKIRLTQSQSTKKNPKA